MAIWQVLAHNLQMILYHGWSDPLVPPVNTIKYYGQVAAHLGGAAKAAIESDFAFLKQKGIDGVTQCEGDLGARMQRIDHLNCFTPHVQVGYQLFGSRDCLKRLAGSILVGAPLWYVVGILITFSPEFAKALTTHLSTALCQSESGSIITPPLFPSSMVIFLSPAILVI